MSNGVSLAGCANCGGACCRKYRVPVTVQDIRRIVDGTGMRPGDFVWLVRGEKEGFRLRRNGPPMEIMLQRREGTGACVLLMEVGPDLGRCGVYAHRPLVCSNFPMTLQLGTVAVRQDTVCGPDAWNITAMDLPRFRRELLADNRARAEHMQLMEAWNKRVAASDEEATDEELYEYLMNHSAEAEERPADTEKSSPPAEARTSSAS